jgi:DNA-binding transcriptional MerR regulator
LDKAPDAFRTISEVADDLKVPQHVLRFWESRFSQIKPMKRAGGRRYYRPDDVALLRGIHHLLYGEGYTIRGVQRILKDEGPRHVQAIWQDGAPKTAGEPEHHGEKRGLLGMLPSLLGREPGEELEEAAEPERVQPPEFASAVRGTFKSDAPARTGLPRADLLKLKESLLELGECRKMLAAAIAPEQH